MPLVQIKGFTFRGSPNTPNGEPYCAVILSGTCPAVRISNFHFDSLYQSSIYTFGWIYGVMDNCLHTLTHNNLTGTMGMAPTMTNNMVTVPGRKTLIGAATSFSLRKTLWSTICSKKR